MAENQKFPQHGAERTASLHTGVISRWSPAILPEHAAADIQDMEISDVGVRSQRRGAFSLGGVASEPPGGINGFNDEQYNEFLVGIWGPHIYRSVGGGAWIQFASEASFFSGHLHQFEAGRTGGDLSIAIAQCENPTNASEGLNGRSLLAVYDITAETFTQVSLAPVCIASFQSRLFYAEDETIGWSEIGVLTAFSDANQLTIDPGIGGRITALIPSRGLEPILWILKEDAIFLLQPRWGTNALIPTAADAIDLTSTTLRALTIDTGCVSTRSAVWTPGLAGGDVMFLSKDGIRALLRAQDDSQQGSAGLPLSYNIPGWIDRINFARASLCAAAVFNNAYHLAVPLDGALQPTHIIRFDLEHRAWSLHNIEAKDLTNQTIVDDRLFFQSPFDTIDCSVTGIPAEATFQAYQMYRGSLDPSTNASEPVLPRYREESRAYVFGDNSVRKRWDYFGLQFSSEETTVLEILYRLDQGEWNSLTEMPLLGTMNTVLLGIDALPWTGDNATKRRRTLSLSDLQPGYELQIGLARPTATLTTEVGRISVYSSEVGAHTLPRDHENDD